MYLYLALAFFLTALSSCNEDELKKDIQVIAHDIEVLADDIDESLDNAEK